MKRPFNLAVNKLPYKNEGAEKNQVEDPNSLLIFLEQSNN